MKIVTTASYYGTGSSAITDLLGEYSCNVSLGGDFECRIAHDMFGLSDLEYYLVENNHRHNSSVALKEFLRLTGIYGLNKRIRLENYANILKVDFEAIVNDYINKLAPLNYKNGSHIDIYRLPDNQIALLKIKGRIHRLLQPKHTITADDTTWESIRKSPLVRAREKADNYVVNPNVDFIEATKQFTDKLFSHYLSGQEDYLVVDQLVPPSNTMRYVRYFNNLKVICVDRDPRDIYYNEKYYWRGGVVPVDDINMFIAWYKSTRAHKCHEKDDTSVVMRLNFEDIICKYDSVVARIEKFLGLLPETHINPQKFLNPEVSIKNIGKWRDDLAELGNINAIEKELIGTMYYYDKND